MNKHHCKDWSEGNICFVEDLRRPRQTDVNVTLQQAPQNERKPQGSVLRPPFSVPPLPKQPPAAYRPPGYEGGSCKDMARYDIVQPHIFIYDVQDTGIPLSKRKRIFGIIEGNCLVDAGGYSNGRLLQRIAVVTTRSFRRFTFNLVIDGTDFYEVRAYNTAGDSDTVNIRNDDYREGGDSDRRPDHYHEDHLNRPGGYGRW